ncbi:MULTISPECIES: OmpA family protein [unclassified Leeuwenhoekiella]|uniref:OmpA family protein n=1 Tax=unclassified Leeuwenhoekiella TaxID=2615029 RepID=UPI000C588443|nr:MULTISPECIES: OmpA family protein [unclassified Leeuwenhoekiella]MAW95346.1 hypothetical protein [Leeuwenhoekiella sp.]MBA81730.1 hypothetical protein [Leeuwenhoekiella sp.]|tara:strand:+ start:26991 stop:27719 length:729 start_codon:yes stop_codon:yes gene_type:complete
MKRFLIAFGVFFCWFLLGILFINTSGALDRKSIFASEVSTKRDIDSTPNVIKPELVPFVNLDSEEEEEEENQDSIIKMSDTITAANLNSSNDQLIQELNKNIQDNKRELAEYEEKLRNAKKRTNATSVAPRTFDALFYPEFKHARFVAEQKATSFLIFVKQKLSADPNLHIKVVGHTDYIGDKEDNYLLALDEAKKVREFLIKSLKLPDNQVSAYSSGETEPIYDRDSANRELNHRIEIYFE